MLAFNSAISSLRLVELPLRGANFTWTNKQCNPLLERFDWFFTSNVPNSFASTLSRDSSNHSSCIISVSTNVPKPAIFRFENFWLQHGNFILVLSHGWSLPISHTDQAKVLTAKFKNIRRVLKAWKTTLPNLASMIQNTKDLLLFLDLIEETRDLTLEEWNFRMIIYNHLQNLLNQQRTYWRQRGKVN